MMNRSVVTIRLLIRAPYWGTTAKNDGVQQHFGESKCNHQKRALLVRPSLPCETGNGTTVRTDRMPRSWFGRGTDNVHSRIPRYEGKPGQIW